MVNKQLLRSKLVAAGDTFKDLAKYIGISQTTLSSKVNGHTDFGSNEIHCIRERYDLSLEEIGKIFFI